MSRQAEIAKRESYCKAYRATNNLHQLLTVEEILEGVTTDYDIDVRTICDIDEKDVEEAVNKFIAEMGIRTHPTYESMVLELEKHIAAENLTRAPLSDLVFEDEKEAVENGYRPYSMSHQETVEYLWDVSIHEDDNREAYSIITGGIRDKMNPYRRLGDSL